VDVGKSLTYIFEDPRWLTKVLIGTVVLIVSSILSSILIGILGFFIIAGYGLDVIKNVRNGERYPMPEWSDRWGEWLVLGLKLAVVLLVWALPLILVMIPTILGAALTGNEDLAWLGGIIITFGACLAILWGIVIFLASPAIYVRLAETGDISSGLQFGDIVEFTREHLGDVLIAVVVYWLASIVIGVVASTVGLLLCVVGVFVTASAGQFITTLVQSHLYGQIGLARPAAGALTPVPAVAPPAAPVENADVATEASSEAEDNA
jgi:hypothetical protein